MQASTALLSSLLMIIPLATANGAPAVKNVHKVVALAPNGRVSIDTHNGVVDVIAWNQANVDVAARIEQTGSVHAADVQKTEVTIEGGGAHVSIKSDYTKVEEHTLGWFSTGRSLPPVYYTIHVPAGARVEIDDHNADVKVTGLRNDVVVNSHNGSVKVKDLDGAANIETHNGSVDVRFARFSKTSSIETHNGSCSVQMPQASKFTLHADAHRSDPVSSDFALVRRGSERSSYTAEANGGGPELRFDAHNGSLRLTKY